MVERRREGRKEEGRVETEFDVHFVMIKIFATDSSCSFLQNESDLSSEWCGLFAGFHIVLLITSKPKKNIPSPALPNITCHFHFK